MYIPQPRRTPTARAGESESEVNKTVFSATRENALFSALSHWKKFAFEKHSAERGKKKLIRVTAPARKHVNGVATDERGRGVSTEVALTRKNERERKQTKRKRAEKVGSN